MPTLTKPKTEVTDLLADTARRFHAPLVEAGVTVGLLAAWPNEGEDCAVKLHGYPCAAVVKVTPYRQRVQGIEDAVITVDGELWQVMKEAERVALLDHELQHLEVALDRDGRLKRDDWGRPKLKVRLHDWELGGFADVAVRHGAAAQEVRGFRDAHTRYHQAIFSWSDDAAAPDGFSPTARVV